MKEDNTFKWIITAWFGSLIGVFTIPVLPTLGVIIFMGCILTSCLIMLIDVWRD